MKSQLPRRLPLQLRPQPRLQLRLLPQLKVLKPLPQPRVPRLPLQLKPPPQPRVPRLLLQLSQLLERKERSETIDMSSKTNISFEIVYARLFHFLLIKTPFKKKKKKKKKK